MTAGHAFTATGPQRWNNYNQSSPSLKPRQYDMLTRFEKAGLTDQDREEIRKHLQVTATKLRNTMAEIMCVGHCLKSLTAGTTSSLN